MTRMSIREEPILFNMLGAYDRKLLYISQRHAIQSLLRLFRTLFTLQLVPTVET